MMIQWNGLGCLTVSGKPIVGEVGFVVDPFDAKVGLRLPKTLQGALTLQSHKGEMANNLKAVDGSVESKRPFSITHAGEYEVQGVFVKGIHAPLKDGTQHTIYRVVIESMNLAFLGALDRPMTGAEIEGLGDIDFLCLPVGGGTVLSPKEAAEAVAQIEPRVVVPTHFAMPGLTIDFKPVDDFVKEVGIKREDMTKIKMARKDLPLENMQLIVLAKA